MSGKTENHLCDKIWLPQEAETRPGKAEPCSPVYVMWVTAPNASQPQTPCAAAAQSCCRACYRIAQPTLRTLGQCMFGIAMLFIIAGIALCIWGYVGTPIRPFQIFGPVCVGIGLLIYVVGCVLCCRQFPAFERTLQKKAQQENARKAVELLGKAEVIDWIHGEPEVYEQFRLVAAKVLNNHG